MSQSNFHHNHILYEGYLHKKGVYNKSWKRRYFVLYKDRTVDYFKDKSHSRQRNKAKGTIQLTHIQMIEFVQYNDPSKIQTVDPISFLNIAPHTRRLSIVHTSFNGVLSSFQTVPEYNSYNRKPNDILSKRTLHSKSDYSLNNNEIESFKNNKSNLKCDRQYSFALISTSRNWILSAPNTTHLRLWISKLTALTQGPQICSGYFGKDKYYILYKNKLLHGYICKNHNKSIIEDIDLNNMLYVKRMTDRIHRNVIEIGLPNGQQNITLCFKNQREANIWYNLIISLFDNDCIIKHKYCSMIKNVYVVHDGVYLCYKHVGMYANFMVIFNNKLQCHSMKNKILFFKKRALRKYFKNKHCTLIRLDHNVTARKASKSRGKYAFCVSDRNNNKKWYFCVQSSDILNEWLDCLGANEKF
eukprot:388109_1